MISLNLFFIVTLLIRSIENRKISLNKRGLTNLNEIEAFNDYDADNSTKLDVSLNRIANIDFFGKFHKLKHIDLSFNYRIDNLNSLFNLTDLEYLNLESNKITRIKILENSTNLNILILNNNPLIKRFRHTCQYKQSERDTIFFK